jgi:FAD/FMN-containing dehydrogenase
MGKFSCKPLLLAWVYSINDAIFFKNRRRHIMSNVIFNTRTDETATLQEQVIKAFEEKLRGELIQSQEEGYDEARAIWNAMIDKRPALIVRCAGVADVIESVNFARNNNLLISVRGGGHNIAGVSVCDGGLMIDLSPMRAVHVDPKAHTARVQGGATFADVDHETQAFGLAVPNGVVSTTGVGGLTLGGGFGRLSRKYGLTADNLLSADVITADGAMVTANADENTDLFWGIRGGGGNFGIVTSFEFKLHHVGPEVLFGPVVYRLEDAAEVLRHYRDFATSAPNECSVWADFLTAPPLPFLPEAVHGTKVLFITPFYIGEMKNGEDVLGPMREFGKPIADAVEPTPYVVAQRTIDDLYANGLRDYWKSHNFVELSDAALDIIVEHATMLPTQQSDLLISHLGGIINDTTPDGTAYPHRDISFVVTPGGRWEDPAKDDAAISWVRECFEALTAHATGRSYVNFITEGAGREREAFGPNYDRLVELKNKYDPTNLFRLNQNVTPTV